MADNIEEILHAVGTLDANDQLRLIARLWASLPPAYWAAPSYSQRLDVFRRLDDVDAGDLSDVPWKVVERVVERQLVALARV